MTDRAAAEAAHPSRPLWADALHVFALCGIAIAQPLFDIIEKNATFFIAHGTDPVGVVAFAAALLLVPPALVMGVLVLVRLVSRRLYRFMHTAAIGMLAGLTVLPFVTTKPVTSLVQIAIFAGVAAIVALAYERVPVVRRYGTILAAAPVALLVVFLGFSPVRSLVVGSDAPTVGRRTSSDTPVVMLLMDEFSLGTILKPDGEIDAKRFPNFARLAERSTWYPNATTNTNATHVALPTILTGRYPRPAPPPPVYSSYPNNLFSLLGASYDTSVDEWVTSLCSVQTCRRRAVVYPVKHLAVDTGLIYLHLVMPARIKASLPPLGHQWAGFFASPADNAQRLRQVPRSIRPAVGSVLDWLSDDEFTSLQLRRYEAFLDSIRRKQRPTFAFLHLGLPHQPWHLLPDARPYERQHTPGLDRTRLRWINGDFANSALQRYVLQVKGTDHLIGGFIDRLEAQRMWDDALVVVMADHGITFKAGHTTREIVGTEGDVLPIPLFVKYPGQSGGRIDDRNAEIVDVFPTVADVIGIDLPWRVDGSSLAGRDPRRPKKRVWASGRYLPPYDADITETKTLISERIRALFGKASGRDDLFGFGPHRELIGRRVARLPVTEPSGPITGAIEQRDRWSDHAPDGPYVPARVAGTLRSARAPTWIAVALNGRIAGFGRPWRDAGGWAFEIMVSDAYIEPGRNDLELFDVDGDDLVRIRTS